MTVQHVLPVNNRWQVGREVTQTLFQSCLLTTQMVATWHSDISLPWCQHKHDLFTLQPLEVWPGISSVFLAHIPDRSHPIRPMSVVDLILLISIRWYNNLSSACLYTSDIVNELNFLMI